MKKFVLSLLFLPLLASANYVVFSKKWGEEIPVRESPSIRGSPIIATISTGTRIEVLGKASEKIKFGSLEDYWYKIKLESSSQEGWVFGGYLVLEQSQPLKEYFEFTVNNLYYYLPYLKEDLKEINQNRSKIFTFIRSMSQERKRFLNYYAYHLLSQHDGLAIAFLIEFMNPGFQSQNKEDPNYEITWLFLNKLLPVFLPSEYKAYSDWWAKEGNKIKINITDQVLTEIFTHIRKNEDEKYRVY